MMARIEEASSVVGALRTRTSKVRELVAAGVIAVATLASAGAVTGTSVSRVTSVRSDTDSVATAGDRRDTTRATVVCSARNAIRLGCLPGLRAGKTTYRALILQPAPVAKPAHGIFIPLGTP